MRSNIDNLPKQKLSRKQKTEAWGKEVIDELEGIINSSNYNGRSSRHRKQVNYDLYNGVLNRSDFEYVVKPHGFSEDDFPAELQHYDIVSPKLSLLMGEEIKRPFNFKVVSENPEAISQVEEKEKELLISSLAAIVNAQLQGEASPDQGQEPPPTPAQIQQYINMDYQGTRELIGQRTLEYLLRSTDIQHKFNIGFKDALVSGEEIYYVGVEGGEPVVRLCNPIDISVVMDPDSDFIDDAQAIVEERWLTLSSILDTYHDSLTPKQIDEIEKNGGRTGDFGDDAPELNYPTSNIFIYGDDQYNKTSPFRKAYGEDGNIRVIHCEWKSMRKIGFISYIDEEGTMREDMLDETFEVPEDHEKERIDGKTVYKFTLGEDMEAELYWEWISEYWEGTKIGEDIYVDIRPKANQRRNMDNPSTCKSGYVGYIYNARNSESVSLMDRMKPFQYLYNIIYYRTELAFAKSKGKMALMDIAQIPSSEGWDVDRWMYYLEAMGIMFINSHEEGKRGQTSNFNQFQSIDLSMGNYINQHVMMLDKIKEELGELSGVSRQRQGQVQTSELVGNTERAVTQSSHITEYWFYFHNEVKKKVLEGLLDVAKLAWRNGKKVQYVLDDMSRVFFTIDGNEFDNTEYGVFVSNSSKDNRNLETLRQLAHSALQAGAVKLSEVATMLTSESMADIKNKLQNAERRQEEQEAKQAEMQQQMQQQQMQMQQQEKQQEMMAKEQQNIRDNNTKIEVALINAEARGDDNDKDDNGIDDSLDRERLQYQKDKDRRDFDLKKKQVEATISNNAEKLKLQKKAANKPKS